MPRVGFETTTPVFEKAETIHALDLETTVSAFALLYPTQFSISSLNPR
jgi:hypothetical protein